jgi:hypothetical protein
MEGGVNLKESLGLGSQMEPGGLKQAEGDRGSLVSLGMARVGEADGHRWGQSKKEEQCANASHTGADATAQIWPMDAANGSGSWRHAPSHRM